MQYEAGNVYTGKGYFCYDEVMNELWQLFGEDGQALKGEGASKDEVFEKGLLHGASHVWIWRDNAGEKEVLLQKRAANKRTWPNRLDISAAGHIDLGEDPLTAALRETNEEIGLVVASGMLKEISVEKTYKITEGGAIENEFQWLYLLELQADTEFSLQEAEVDSLAWQKINEFERASSSDLYVPHGNRYYEKVIAAIRSGAAARAVK
jgi:isopentenyl-diphosphate delta-isomerase